MGKYSKSLATRLQRTLKPFRKLNDKEREYLCSREHALKVYQGPQLGVAVDFANYYKNKEWWASDDYIVILDKQCPTKKTSMIGTTLLGHPIWHMRIMRRDGGRMHDWCVIQSIKNEIVGPEFEGIELYPAHSRLMDEGNCYHLWILAPNEGETEPPRIPLGYNIVPKLMMTKQNFERMSPGERREIKEKKGMVAIVSEELLALAEKEFPGEMWQLAIEKYVEKHPEVVATMEKWEPEKLAE